MILYCLLLFITVSIVNSDNRILESGKIVGGGDVSQESFPSFVYLKGFGGGSLIHPDAVLTTAGMKGEYVGQTVFIGGIKEDGSDAKEKFRVRQEVAHKKYKFPDNNIMIVFLSKESTAPLQVLNFDPNIPAIDDSVTTIGFGTQSSNVTAQSIVLQGINTTVQSCNSYSAPFNDAKYICAGGDGNKGICNGDDGSPLLKSDGVQIGIANFKKAGACASAGVPDGYTRTSPYEDWIKETLCRYSSNPPNGCSCSLCRWYQFRCLRRLRCSRLV